MEKLGDTEDEGIPSSASHPPQKKLQVGKEIEAMRREIRQLQEKRMEGLMSEMEELRRERDLERRKVKLMNRTMEDMSVENAVLKETIGRGDQVQKLIYLEKALQEEQLYSSDLKKKLQSANKQIASLKTKLLEQHSGVLSGVGEDLGLDRSKSTSDLEQEKGEGEETRAKELKPGSGSGSGSSPDHQYQLPRLTANKQQRDHPQPKTEVVSPKPPSSSFSNSPTVVPRRYKLAAVQCRAVGTQVDLSTAAPTKGGEGTSAANAQETQELKEEVKSLQETISKMRDKKEELDTKTKEEVKQVKLEAELLRSHLSELSTWVRHQIHSVGEDIDVCRMIYTLHGSLSQEKSLLKEMQEHLELSEKKLKNSEVENRELKETIECMEGKYRQLKKQNELQHEKIILLTPSRSSRQTFYPSPLTSSPVMPHRQSPSSPKFTHRLPPLPSNSSPRFTPKRPPQHSSSSPLLTHSSPKPPVTESSDDDSNII